MELNLKTIVRSLSLLSLAFIPASGRVRTLYRALADVNSLCGEKLYQNLGYWKDDPDSLDMAAEADKMQATLNGIYHERIGLLGFFNF